MLLVVDVKWAGAGWGSVAQELPPHTFALAVASAMGDATRLVLWLGQQHVTRILLHAGNLLWLRSQLKGHDRAHVPYGSGRAQLADRLHATGAAPGHIPLPGLLIDGIILLFLISLIDGVIPR